MTKVLIIVNGKRQSEVYHIPQEDDPTKPKCERTTTATLRLVDKATNPHARACKFCTGEYNTSGGSKAHFKALKEAAQAND